MMWKNSTVCKVLRESPGIQDASRYAEQMGWSEFAERAADPARGVNYEFVWKADDRVIFTYGLDDISQFGFILFNGEDVHQIEQLLEDAALELNTWTIDEMADAVVAADTPEKRGHAILRLALGSPPHFDQRVFDSLRDALLDDNPEIRNAGIHAATYSPIPEYRPMLEEVRQNDPLPELSDLAAAALDSYDVGGVGELE